MKNPKKEKKPKPWTLKVRLQPCCLYYHQSLAVAIKQLTPKSAAHKHITQTVLLCLSFSSLLFVLRSAVRSSVLSILQSCVSSCLLFSRDSRVLVSSLFPTLLLHIFIYIYIYMYMYIDVCIYVFLCFSSCLSLLFFYLALLFFFFVSSVLLFSFLLSVY